MNFILSEHLERLTNAGTAHFQFEIRFLAIEMSFDKLTQLYTVFNPYAVLVVDFNHNAIVSTDSEVGQKVVLTVQPFVNQRFY